MPRIFARDRSNSLKCHRSLLNFNARYYINSKIIDSAVSSYNVLIFFKLLRVAEVAGLSQCENIENQSDFHNWKIIFEREGVKTNRVAKFQTQIQNEKRISIKNSQCVFWMKGRCARTGLHVLREPGCASRLSPPHAVLSEYGCIRLTPNARWYSVASVLAKWSVFVRSRKRTNWNRIYQSSCLQFLLPDKSHQSSEILISGSLFVLHIGKR